MKKNYLILFALLIMILFILTHPAVSIHAAGNGLLLWYEQILPALLPLAILSNIMVYSNYMQIITKYLYPLTKHIVPTSQYGCFAFLGGLLFGFPMGSKISADLTMQQKISKEEGEILSICFNQLSPVFICGYLLTNILEMPKMILFSYIALYLPPVCYAIFQLKKLKSAPYKKAASDSHLDFGIVDAGIMNGFESLTRLGGYIILFSIFAALLNTCNLRYPLVNLICTGMTEVTTGISCLKTSALLPEYIYPMAMFFASFGGLCGFAQTCSMTKTCAFSKSRYLLCRLCFAVISSILGYFFYLCAFS